MSQICKIEIQKKWQILKEYSQNFIYLDLNKTGRSLGSLQNEEISSKSLGSFCSVPMFQKIFFPICEKHGELH